MSIFGIKNGILCQQVNCQNAIGAGLSGEIIRHFPIVKENYHKSFEDKQRGDLYGKYNIIKVDDDLYIANLYTQFFMEMLQKQEKFIQMNKNYLMLYQKLHLKILIKKYISPKK